MYEAPHHNTLEDVGVGIQFWGLFILKLTRNKYVITIFDLLKRFKLNNKKVAIEHNGIIIPNNNYKKKFLKNNDIIEIVHFIGGG